MAFLPTGLIGNSNGDMPSPTSLLLWSAGIVFIIWYIVTAFQAWYSMRHIPGPFFARFSYLPYIWHLATNQMDPYYTRIHAQYGNTPFVRISPQGLVTNDPDVLRKIGSARSTYGRGQWYKGGRFHEEYENVGSTLDIQEHDRLKAKTASGYSGREAGAEFEPVIDEQMRRLADLIRRKYLSEGEEARPVEISSLMQMFTLDVITNLGYSKSFGHLDEGLDVHGYIADVKATMKLRTFFTELPLVRSIMLTKYGWKMFGPTTKDPKGAGKLMALIHDIVEERFKQRISLVSEKDAKARDMVDGFMRNGLSQHEIEGEAALQVFAGSDTTAITLSVAIVSLATTPRAYARFKAEISSAIASGHVSADKPITFEQAQKLPYLQAVIWESFRTRCPANFGFYKTVPPEGDTLKGVFLPGGTDIGNNILALSRNVRVFGKDVEVFRPERFLVGPDCDEDTRAYRTKSIEVVFGGGRWMCSGKQVAMYELHKALFELFRRFDFQVMNPKNAWQEGNYVIPTLHDMWVKVTDAGNDERPYPSRQ